MFKSWCKDVQEMKFILFIFLLSPSFVYAGLFGSSTYEECINDGKVGRNSAELFFKIQECEKKFPKLPSIKNKSNKQVDCTFNGIPDAVLPVKINSDRKTATIGKKDDVKITSFTDSEILLQSDNKDLTKTFLRINYNNGKFEWISNKINAEGICSEIK